MKDVIINIVLGAAGSILAAVILFLLTKLYRFGTRDTFRSNLEIAKSTVYQICNQHYYPDDYELIISQIDILYRCVVEMYSSIYPMTLLFSPKNKALIVTILYNILRLCNLIKHTTVGFSGNEEKEARLKKIHRYLYTCESLENNNISTTDSQLKLIELLWENEKLSSALLKAHWMELEDSTNTFWADLTMNYIDINSFKPDSKTSHFMQKGCISKEAYETMLNNAKAKIDKQKKFK